MPKSIIEILDWYVRRNMIGLLSPGEIERRDIEFVKVVKERQARIEEVKRQLMLRFNLNEMALENTREKLRKLIEQLEATRTIFL